MIENDKSLERILTLLQPELGSGARLTHARILKQEPGYWVLQAHLNWPSQDFIIKLALPETRRPCDFTRIAAVYRYVAQNTHLPVPEILLVGESSQISPFRCLVQNRLPGIELNQVRQGLSPQEVVYVQRQIGEAVAELHSLRFPAFGELDKSSQPSPGQDLLSNLIDRAKRILPNLRLLELFIDTLDRFQDRFTSSPLPCLAHEDLHAYNLLFEPGMEGWRLSGILDFDKAWAGPAESDLARLEIWRGMTSPAFWEAYRSMATVDETYPLRRPLYQLLWCLEYAQPTPEHFADTARVCTELGLPLVVSFEA